MSDIIMSGSRRRVEKTVLSQWMDEGVGARVRRSIGRPQLQRLDPFLLLDEFRVSAPAGFPDHPHRGFETVTYMLSGITRHEDFLGNKGEIGPGDLQWMTAGRGVVHCEMPRGEEPAHGLQLWVNLTKRDKMIDPVWQNLMAKDIPVGERDGVKVNVIAGSSMGIQSPIYTRTPSFYLDFSLNAGAEFEQSTELGWTVFAYTITGTVSFDEESVDAHHTVVFSDGQTVVMRNKTTEPCRFVLIGGKPIGEPVAQYGPFVMNTEQELIEAKLDYGNARNGFERSRNWNSSYFD